MYEELLIGDNVSPTDHSRILKAQEECLAKEVLEDYLQQIEVTEEQGNIEGLKAILKEAVPGFTPEEQIVDVIFLQKNN